MKGHGTKLERKQEEAISALLSQRTIDDAARVAGVSEKTLRRWLEVPEFGAAYREARRQVVGHATARLQHATSAAASVLLAVMLDSSVGASNRIRAAQTVLDIAVKAIELDDIEARVTALEVAAEKEK